MDALTPVVLFAYRRPAHTLRLLESLAANTLAERTRLTIFCDGPKTVGEHDAVAEVRRIARMRAWCGEVKLVERDDNLGLAESVIRGVSHALRDHERVIVLEDDLLLSPTFLEFMNNALARYRDHECVMQVSGYMFPVELPEATRSSFLPLISSWGWGTWRRAWQHFDASMSGFDQLAAAPRARRRFDLENAYPFFNMLQQQRRGVIDSWAVRWYLSVFLRGGLTLFPPQSLVRNLGWDGSGAHCTADDFFDAPLCDTLPTDYPGEAAVSWPTYLALQRFLRPRFFPAKQPLARRLLGRIRGFVATK